MVTVICEKFTSFDFRTALINKVGWFHKYRYNSMKWNAHEFTMDNLLFSKKQYNDTVQLMWLEKLMEVM